MSPLILLISRRSAHAPRKSRQADQQARRPPTRTSRTAAICQHLLEMPAPVVADALSYHPVTTTKIASHAGATWSRYAPGDHTRTGDS